MLEGSQGPDHGGHREKTGFYFKCNEKQLEDYMQGSDLYFKRILLSCYVENGPSKSRNGNWKSNQNTIAVIQLGNDSGLNQTVAAEREREMDSGYSLQVKLPGLADALVVGGGGRENQG